jgi:hypothetical protein
LEGAAEGLQLEGNPGSRPAEVSFGVQELHLECHELMRGLTACRDMATGFDCGCYLFTLLEMLLVAVVMV